MYGLKSWAMDTFIQGRLLSGVHDLPQTKLLVIECACLPASYNKMMSHSSSYVLIAVRLSGMLIEHSEEEKHQPDT